MILTNLIGWCDATGNKVIGCDKVSDGCKNCYAANDTPARVLRSRGIETWGPQGTRVPVEGFSKKVRRLNKLCICDHCHQTHPFSTLSAGGEGRGEVGPLTGKAACPCGGPLRRIRLFANSNSDWLDMRWPIATFTDFLRDMQECPNIDLLVLTKRPENCIARLIEAHKTLEPIARNMPLSSFIVNWCGGNAPENVWFGVSVENNDHLWRIEEMLMIPARTRFISAEPLLESLNVRPYLRQSPSPGGEGRGEGRPLRPRAVHWVIVGGESGRGARPCNIAHIRSIVDQCVAAEVPVYVKQLGSFSIEDHGSQRRRNLWDHPKSGDIHEWPEPLRLRQFPHPR